MSEQAQAALVWRFHEAPKELRALSTNGGDEDWLVEIPKEWEEKYFTGWIDTLDAGLQPRGHKHPSKPGWMVYIGAHS